MKKILAIVLLSTTVFVCNAQKLYKSKALTLAAIEDKGIKYAQDKNDINIYWYIRYDKFGETMVQLTFQNNVLKMAVFAPKTPTGSLERMHDLFKTISAKEALEWELSQGVATNTDYYAGKALFQNTERVLKIFLID